MKEALHIRLVESKKDGMGGREKTIERVAFPSRVCLSANINGQKGGRGAAECIHIPRAVS